jgi:serine protease Do
VIISADGYIATNNHVVKGAEKVEVTLEDKRSYAAEVIGTDPNTDLALLKIKESELPFLPFGNSSGVLVGEWVLAVGNPFNLTSTVTAGIVSAKGRSLNLLNEEFAIESFIQTDAAVNPGNSGGALINTSGQLVGINTAIASETGSYAGYSFAIPVNIVRKVMEDLREYGKVQRGIIGVQIRNINSDMAEEYGLASLDGAFVTGTIAGGAASAAGIKPGDVITKVNATPVRGSAELQEEIGTYRPGEKVKLTVVRAGETILLDVILRNQEGKTSMSEVRAETPETPETASLGRLGAEMETLSPQDKTDLGLESGVKVRRLGPGKLRDAGLEEGFVITRVNKKFVEDPKEVERIVTESEGGILIEGVTAAGKKQFFAFE